MYSVRLLATTAVIGAFASADVLVVSRNNDAVMRYFADGREPELVCDCPDGETLLAASPQTFFVAGSGSLAELTYDGHLLRTMSVPQGAVAISPVGTLLIAQGGAIFEIAADDGRAIREIPFTSGASDLQVIGSRVFALTANAVVEFTYPAFNVHRSVPIEFGSTKFSIGPDGAMYFASLTRVMRWDLSENPAEEYVSGGGLQDARAVAFATSGEVRVLGRYGTVFRYDPTTRECIGVIAPAPNMDGAMDMISVAGDGCSVPAIRGDLDGDRDVDLIDLAVLLSNFGLSCN